MYWACAISDGMTITMALQYDSMGFFTYGKLRQMRNQYPKLEYFWYGQFSIWILIRMDFTTIWEDFKTEN